MRSSVLRVCVRPGARLCAGPAGKMERRTDGGWGPMERQSAWKRRFRGKGKIIGSMLDAFLRPSLSGTGCMRTWLHLQRGASLIEESSPFRAPTARCKTKREREQKNRRRKRAT